jgi:MFS family permease
MSAWGNADFRRLWFGQSVSQIGDSVTALALPFTAILVLQADTFQVALLTTMGTISWLILGLAAGTWIDRVRRQPVMVAADLGRCVLLLAVPLSIWLHVINIWGLCLIALLLGTLSVLFDVASPAFLPSIVDDRDLVQANGALYATSATMSAIGPAVGGALVRLVGPVRALLFDPITFVVSAYCIVRMRVREVATSSPQSSLVRDIRIGLVDTLRDKLFRTIALTAACANVGFAGVFALQLLFFVRVLGLSSTTAGLLLSLGATGAVLGSLLASRLARRLSAPVILRLAPALTLPFMIALPLAGPGPAIALAALAGLLPQAGAAMFNTVGISMLQQQVPRDRLGRTVASIRVLTRSSLAVGGLIAGLLGAQVGVRSALWYAAAIVAATPLLTWLMWSSATQPHRRPTRRRPWMPMGWIGRPRARRLAVREPQMCEQVGPDQPRGGAQQRVQIRTQRTGQRLVYPAVPGEEGLAVDQDDERELGHTVHLVPIGLAVGRVRDAEPCSGVVGQGPVHPRPVGEVHRERVGGAIGGHDGRGRRGRLDCAVPVRADDLAHPHPLVDAHEGSRRPAPVPDLATVSERGVEVPNGGTGAGRIGRPTRREEDHQRHDAQPHGDALHLVTVGPFV